MGTYNEFSKKVFAYFANKQNDGIELTDEERYLMLEAEGKLNAFVITSLCFDDLKQATGIKNPLPDDIMDIISDKMAEDYCEQLFWEHLPTITDIVLDRRGLVVEREECVDDDDNE